MNDSHKQWTDRFSDYLAGELDDAARDRLDEHLSGCGACRRPLEDLRDVVARARSLEDLEPTRDLWPGIAAAIGGSVRAQGEGRSGKVIALPTASAGTGRDRPSRIAMTPRQLTAAAVALIAISVAATSWAGPGLGARAAAPGTASEESVGGAVTVAADVPELPEALSSELSELEDVLRAARARLDPNTVRVIERNLTVIEGAIADSRQALAVDPENEFLEHHLNRVYERKLEYLRDAARVIAWAG
jgi:hypothetical protein